MVNEATVQSAVMPTYARFPLTLVKGKGSWVWDDTGNQYLDFTSGIATCNLGHVPDKVKEALEAQLNTLWHCSNLFTIPIQEQLAQLLVENSCADQAFFCNSGAEANEGAIKMARRYAQAIKKNDKFEVVTFKQSFHGRTLATLSATGQEKIQQGFAPLMPGFRYLPYNDKAALEQLVQPNTCAVMLELVQGEGGVVPANPEWLNKLVQLCKKHDLLLIIDEIQTGIGRTGTLFCYEQYNIEPDIITLAKGLGSGFPVGAILAKQEVAQAFGPGSHGSTFGGNPLAVTAGHATLSYMLEQNIPAQCQASANYLKEKLQELKAQFPIIKEIRGKGLLLGLLVGEKAADIVTSARENEQLLVLLAGPEVVRILPPLNATKEELNKGLEALKLSFERL
jgi:acetylornithine aminotransferase